MQASWVKRGRGAPTACKPKRDVIGDLPLIERPQMEVRGNALGKLMQLRRQEQIPQLGLSDQNQLQDLKLVGVDIGDHSQMFERFRLEILRLVDDQDGSSSIGVLTVEKIL